MVLLFFGTLSGSLEDGLRARFLLFLLFCFFLLLALLAACSQHSALESVKYHAPMERDLDVEQFDKVRVRYQVQVFYALNLFIEVRNIHGIMRVDVS